jgi:predicted O-linked N-acetylglucosamine transferase (SPINDLY family)
LEKLLLDWEGGPSVESAAVETRNIHANAWYNLGCAALADFTADDHRLEMFQKAIDLDPDHMLARFNHAFAYNYSYQASPEQVFDAHRQAGAWLEGKAANRRKLLAPGSDASRRVRMGYLSSDFRWHSVAHFILPVLRQHDRNRFEIFIYHNHAKEDSITAEARQLSDHFRNISKASDEQATQLIRDDKLDILIDLNGLTQHHRLAVLANRVAPIQLNWIGYPNTTGLAAMDYRLVDALTDPPGPSEQLHSETLIRLPVPFLAFASLEPPPPLSSPPCDANGFISFGSFNALPKLNPPLLECWAGILLQVPDSRLLIKNLGMDFESPRQQIIEVFTAKGLDPQRISFAGKNDSQAGHLQFYDQIDISLDSYPYNGTTTTCDSLVMGVPVVSRAGAEHRSRVGLSLLSAIGLESLVACSENELIKIATSLAADRNRLIEYRATLRRKLLSSPLADAASLTASLEKEVLNALEKWHGKEGVS